MMSMYTVVSYSTDRGLSDFRFKNVSPASPRGFSTCRCLSGLSLRSVFSKSELKVKILADGGLLGQEPLWKIVRDRQVRQSNFKQVGVGLYPCTCLCLIDQSFRHS